MSTRALALFAVTACAAPPPAHPQPLLVLATPNTAPKPHARVALDWDKDLGYLPVDSELVVGVDLAQLRTSGLWAQYAPQVLAKAQPVFARMQTVCGFDLVATLDGFAFGAADVSGTARGVAILHGLSRAQLKTCLDNNHGGTLPATTDGDVTLIAAPTGPVATTFVDDTTVMIVIGPAATKDGVANLLHASSTLPSSVAFSDMWKLIDKRASVWFLINGNSSVLTTLKSVTPDATAIFGSVRITDELALDGRVRTSNTTSASSLVGLIQPQLSPQVTAMFSRIDVSADANDAHLVFAMTPDQLERIAEMISPPVRRDPKGR